MLHKLYSLCENGGVAQKIANKEGCGLPNLDKGSIVGCPYVISWAYNFANQTNDRPHHHAITWAVMWRAWAPSTIVSPWAYVLIMIDKDCSSLTPSKTKNSYQYLVASFPSLLILVHELWVSQKVQQTYHGLSSPMAYWHVLLGCYVSPTSVSKFCAIRSSLFWTKTRMIYFTDQSLF